MTPIERTNNEAKSADLIAQNIEVLKSLFPEAVSEGKVDITVLKDLLGQALLPEEERDEKYGLNWFGKRKARQIALTPSTGTLRPCKGDSVDWDTTKNLMIEGDNLEVLKLLQKSYAGKIKLIYIDPPYNTGKDFVYPDNFQDNIKNYLELTGQIEGGAKMEANTESSGRYHTDWLNMMYPRLRLAKNLLRNDGAIFISIDGNEHHNLLSLMNEIFGEENYVDSIIWDKKSSAKGVPPKNMMVNVHEYIVVYQKDDGFRFLGEERTEESGGFKNPDNDPRGPWRESNIKSTIKPNEDAFTIVDPETGKEYTNTWAFSKTSLEKMIRENRILWKDSLPKQKEFMLEMTNETKALKSNWGVFDAQSTTVYLKSLLPEVLFENPKPVTLMKHLINVSLQKEDIIVDFFAGSSTTADAIFQLNNSDNGNRHFLLVQLPEPIEKDCEAYNAGFKTIADIGKERIRRAGKKIKDENPLFTGDLGFRVFKLDTSNILPWEPEWDHLDEILKKSTDHVKTGRSEADILYELLLKLGLDLAVPIEEKIIASKKVYSIGAGTLLVCLDKSIGRADADPLALGIVSWHKELAPVGETTCVFLDSGFADDVTKTNLSAILSQHGLGNVRSL